MLALASHRVQGLAVVRAQRVRLALGVLTTQQLYILVGRESMALLQFGGEGDPVARFHRFESFSEALVVLGAHGLHVDDRSRHARVHGIRR